MKAIARFAISVAIVLNACTAFRRRVNTHRKQIAGGEEVDIETAPYVAQLVRFETIVCGATIISDRWLLTAAHCLLDLEDLNVVTGSSRSGCDGSSNEIVAAILHKDFDKNKGVGDIGLVKLNKTIQFSEKQKSIEISKTSPTAGEYVKISGYGKIAFRRRLSPVLKSANALVIDLDSCKEMYREETDYVVVDDRMFCAGAKGIDACPGDSGGPALSNGQLVGVISNGKECALAKYPGIYTDVSKYVGWIERNISEKPV